MACLSKTTEKATTVSIGVCISIHIVKLHTKGVSEDNSNVIVLFSQEKNTCRDPSLELSQRDSSNEESQHVVMG